MSDSKRLSVSIPAALNKQLEQIAASTFQKPGDVVRQAIRHAVAKPQSEAGDAPR
jgi:metal-responsive CopG/Arc/MetJ family transcriptional regulator